MKLRKLFLFFLICIFYQNIALTQLLLTNSFEANMADLNPEILHKREKIEKIRVDSVFILGCAHIEVYFDDLGRDTVTAYFEKEDSIPYKRNLKYYSNNQSKEIIFDRTYGKWDTIKMTTSHYEEGVLQSEDVLKFSRIKITSNVAAPRINETKKEYKQFYYYDVQNNLLKKIKKGVDEEKEEEVNSYVYNDKNQVIKKETPTFFWGNENIRKSLFSYDTLGNLIQEKITEDTTTVIHIYSNEVKKRTEVIFENDNKKLIYLYDFEGKCTSVSNVNEDFTFISIKEYEYDKNNNWIKKYIYQQKDGGLKELKRISSRKIYYRE